MAFSRVPIPNVGREHRSNEPNDPHHWWAPPFPSSAFTFFPCTPPSHPSRYTRSVPPASSRRSRNRPPPRWRLRSRPIPQVPTTRETPPLSHSSLSLQQPRASRSASPQSCSSIQLQTSRYCGVDTVGEMELASLSCSPTSGLRLNRIEKSSDGKNSSILILNRKAGVLCVSRSGGGQKSGISTRISCSYVGGGELGLSGVSRKTDLISKVMIPGLLDEPRGNSSPRVSSHFWEWKPKFTVHYETSGLENTGSPAVLFLPGFGVGSFHYEKQLKDLGREYRVYTLDFLGQGKSLPLEDPTSFGSMGNDLQGDEIWGFGEQAEPWAEELVYSADLWRDQVHSFVEEVIGEPVYVVGNSLGGFMALYFAACNPELVKGITLLNATPFWGFLPNPETSPRLAKLFPWAGTFPLPPRVRSLIALVWQKISEPESIYQVLKQVYADHSTMVDKVFNKIIEVTQHPAASASFASIMFAPRAKLSFREALIRCKMQDIPICLMYGKEDPWVKPIWGLRAKQRVPEAPFYEISPAGHCPHDEVPEVVNYVIRGWIQNLESQGLTPLPLLEGCEFAEHAVSRDVEFVKGGSRKSVRVNVLGSNFTVWSQVRSFVKSRISDARIVSV